MLKSAFLMFYSGFLLYCFVWDHFFPQCHRVMSLCWQCRVSLTVNLECLCFHVCLFFSICENNGPEECHDCPNPGFIEFTFIRPMIWFECQFTNLVIVIWTKMLYNGFLLTCHHIHSNSQLLNVMCIKVAVTQHSPNLLHTPQHSNLPISS